MSVQSQIDRLNAVKERIRTNLIAQGVAIPDDAMLEDMAAQILSVSGEDGVSATHSWNGTTLTITSASGTSSADLKGDKGDKGDSVKGATGSRGLSVLRITTAPSGYTTATGGFTPTYRVALSTVLSQAKTPDVVVGDTVIYSYYTYPVGYVDASYVYLGARVSIRGATGAAGTTPARGTDYWTEADQEAIVQQVIAALGTPVFGRVDADNSIILTGELVDGTYTVKYEDAEGNETIIGEYIKTSAPTYTNVLPLATTNDGQTVYNGTGYKVGARIGSSGSEGTVANTSATNPIFLTGFIQVPAGATIRMKNCFIDTNGVNGTINNSADQAYYGHDLAGLNACMVYTNLYAPIWEDGMTNYKWSTFVNCNYLASKPTVDSNGYVTEFTLNTTATKYIRMILGGDPTTAIITVNEPITD